MIQGFYSAASALDVASRNHDVVAQNLAHANMPGYRRRTIAFQSFEQALSAAYPNGTRTTSSPQVSRVRTVFEPGNYQITDAPLDLALQGNGFFVLQGPQGPLYTRNGVFTLNGEGELRSMDGLRVAGTGGTITIPPGARIITVREDGAVNADGAEVGRLEIAEFQNPNVLRPVGTTLFEAPAGVQLQPGTTTVQQGFRESSNVQVVDEMVQMIAGMRHYEAAQRALRTLSDAIELDTNPQSG